MGNTSKEEAKDLQAPGAGSAGRWGFSRGFA